MKITVEFSSLAEFFAHVKHGEGFLEQEATAEPSKFEQAQAKARAVAEEKPVDTGTGTIVGATPQEQKQIEAEENAAPAYVLQDAQKAVREVVKKKGKDAAKEILSRFPHKDKEGAQATGASSLRPEDYPAAIAAFEEALNG